MARKIRRIRTRTPKTRQSQQPASVPNVSGPAIGAAAALAITSNRVAATSLNIDTHSLALQAYSVELLSSISKGINTGLIDSAQAKVREAQAAFDRAKANEMAVIGGRTTGAPAFSTTGSPFIDLVQASTKSRAAAGAAGDLSAAKNEAEKRLEALKVDLEDIQKRSDKLQADTASIIDAAKRRQEELLRQPSLTERIASYAMPATITAAKTAGAVFYSILQGYSSADVAAKKIYADHLQSISAGGYVESVSTMRAYQGIASRESLLDALSIFEKSPLRFLGPGAAFDRERETIAMKKGALQSAEALKFASLMGLEVDLDAPGIQYAALAPLGMFGPKAARGLRTPRSVPTELLESAADVLSSIGSSPLGFSVREALVNGRGDLAVRAALNRAAAAGDLSAIQALSAFEESPSARKSALGILDTEYNRLLGTARLNAATSTANLSTASGKYMDASAIYDVEKSLNYLAEVLSKKASQLETILGADSPEAISARAEVTQVKSQLGATRVGYITGRATESLGILAAASGPRLLAQARLPITGDYAGASMMYSESVEKQINVLRNAANLLPEGPVRDKYLAQIASLQAEKVSTEIEFASAATNLQTSRFNLSLMAEKPYISASEVYAPVQAVLGGYSQALRTNEYFSGVAANRNIPLSMRISAQAEALNAAASIPGYAAAYYQLGVSEISAGLSNRRTAALGLLPVAGLLGTSVYTNAISTVADEASWWRAVAEDSNAPYSTRMTAATNAVSAGASLTSMSMNILGIGLEKLSNPYKLAAIRQAGEESRLSMLPFGFGGLGVVSKGISLKGGRLADISAIRNRLSSEGLLTSDLELELASEEENLRTSLASSITQLLYGAENRLPALRLNVNGIARYNAQSLAGLIHPYAAIAFGGQASLANQFNVQGSYSADPVLIAKLDELIAAVKQGLSSSGIMYSEPVPEWSK